MRARRGEFYIYQQHDDQVSPDYVAALVAAARQWPQASVCFSKVKISGLQNRINRAGSYLGDPVTRALRYMEGLDAIMLRGLMRGSALAATSGLIMNEFEGYGSENRFLAELALAGEFRFVEGPTYYKRIHGRNLHLKWYSWPDERKRDAWVLLAASMTEVIVPAGEFDGGASASIARCAGAISVFKRLAERRPQSSARAVQDRSWPRVTPASGIY